MRLAAAKVAEFFGAEERDLAFVDNATTGVNTVLRSIPFAPGDEILVTDHTYGAVVITANHIARQHGATVRTATFPAPGAGPDAYVDAIAAALTPRTRIAILDHVTSDTALLLPLANMAARCRAAGVPVLVDGAHAPGAIPLDLPALGVDWYTGNLHKWAWSPRSCAILWAPPERQKDLHPLVISWCYGEGFAREFDWLGTRDPSNALAAPEGIAMMRELGVAEVRAYNHQIAWTGAQRLASRWGTEFRTPESMIGTMATLPLPERAGSTREDAARLRDALLFEDHIEIQLHAAGGRLHVRISGQIYNDLEDVDRLGEAVEARLAKAVAR
jgi:isopenicillin-N epimerase